MKFSIGDIVCAKYPEKDDPMESLLGWSGDMSELVGEFQVVDACFPADDQYPVNHYRLADQFYYAENWLVREGEK